MNLIVNNMPKYDHRQHVLSDWLAELEQRFQLGEVGEDKHKITWCQLLIGATGSSILSGLEDDASWDTAKETLLSLLGIGSVKDESWAALKHLKKGSKEIVELAGEAEKLGTRRSQETPAICRQNTALRFAMGRSSLSRVLYSGTAAPTQPDPQTVHLNAAQQQRKKTSPPNAASPAASQPLPTLPREISSPAALQPLPSPPREITLPAATPHTASHTLLLQTAEIPAETARLVRCHNPWPTEDVYFCPEDALPAFVTGIPALSSGPELWIAIHNHQPEPLRLHSGQNIGVLEVMTVANTPSSTSKSGTVHQPPVPEHLSPLQQQQLNDLFKELSDMFSQGEDDLSCTPLPEHTIETHRHPLRQPYRRQNPAVRQEEIAPVQQMLASDVIRPSNSPWASPVVMVKKKTVVCASVLTSVNSTRLPSRMHTLYLALTTSSTHYTGLAGSQLSI